MKWSISIGTSARALGKRRHSDRHDIQTVVEILAETSRGNLLLQIAVAGRDHTDIHLDAALTAEAREALLLQGTKDLALGFERHISDFVEQQRTAMGALERADLARSIGTGKAGFTAEQLNLHALGAPWWQH